MFTRTTEELCEIAKAGGSLILHADVRPTEDLVAIAHSLFHGANLTLEGMMSRPTSDMRSIAAAAPGRVTFRP